MVTKCESITTEDTYGVTDSADYDDYVEYAGAEFTLDGDYFATVTLKAWHYSAEWIAEGVPGTFSEDDTEASPANLKMTWTSCFPCNERVVRLN